MHPDSPEFPAWMGPQQIEELIALNATYKTGQDRVTMGEAHLWSVTVNANRQPGSRAYTPEDLMPKKVKPMDAAEQQAMFFRSGVA